MKKVKFLLLIMSIIALVACKKTCENPNPKCEDKPESGMCLAYFESWFYNSKTNQCEKIGYSGCSAKGFETEAACKTCKCK